MATLATFQKSLAQTAKHARAWYWSASILKTRDDYLARGKLGDKGLGAVYVYLGKREKAIYVGESGRPIKRRMHDIASPHKNAPWWKKWTHVRFMNVGDRTDRLTLELFLILACSPVANTKPGIRVIKTMYATQQSLQPTPGSARRG